jgi:TonB-dependent receptor
MLIVLTPALRAEPAQEQPGSIRGSVIDKDFVAPLPGVTVENVDTQQRVTTNAQGTYLFERVPPGKYTLVFFKEGYFRQVKSDVVVLPGQMTDVSMDLAGEYTDMEEFVVQELVQAGVGMEAVLLQLRAESPALLDSVGADMISRAGAGDAAGALRLVAGATTVDGKSAVIRGLPDRYISSQLNGVRLPSADEDKRAVELDQFPSAVIESVQVSKTFTPDQQGDASGGAVNVKLKGIPDESIFEFKVQASSNSQVTGKSDFLTYEGGGVDFWGKDDGGRDIQSDKLGENWDGAVGVSRDDAPTDYKWSMAVGGKRELGSGLKLGGFASFFYDRDSSSYEDGVNDSKWVASPGEKMSPETNQGSASSGDFKTALFDVEQASQSVQWGGLGVVGIESERHSLALSYLYTHAAEDTATLAEDTRGKKYFFPGYDPSDPFSEGNNPDDKFAAPYLRLETLDYQERTTSSLQLTGEHALPFDGFRLGDAFQFAEPKLDWTISSNAAERLQPDKRQFGALWIAPHFNPGFPPFIPPFFERPRWIPYKPGANFNLGNLQRIWKDTTEDGRQYSLNLELPFQQWSKLDGYVKTGVFHDRIDRSFNQDTFSNFGDSGAGFEGGFDEFWSGWFPGEDHPITAAQTDVDYEGELEVSAWYAMFDLPLNSKWTAIGGVRLESTEIGVINDPEAQTLWFPPGGTQLESLEPGEADVEFSDDSVLPALALTYQATEKTKLHASYSETIARQTFKELTPIVQQEFLGGPVFIGNPELDMSSLENYDLRVDYTPYEGALLSASYFDKRLEDAIEYVQKVAEFNYTTAVNYPKGELSGFELEIRQDLGRFSDRLAGLSAGANATFIESEVTLPADEVAGFELPEIAAPMTSRDMTNAPEHLFNLYLTYDLERTGTQVSLFYTVQGDTLISGAGQSDGNFVPSIYALEYDTLNLSLTQKLGQHFKLQLQAKNLTDPDIETVYRSEYIGDDELHTSFSRGVEFSLGIGARFQL